MLARLASVSLVAIRTLFEQNMSSTLKDILTSADLSHRRPHSHLGDMHSNLVFNYVQHPCTLYLLEANNFVSLL